MVIIKIKVINKVRNIKEKQNRKNKNNNSKKDSNSNNNKITKILINDFMFYTLLFIIFIIY